MKRKYLKKVVSAALIGTLVVSAVSGCGNSEKESTDSKKTGEKTAKHGKKRLQIRLRHIRNW